MSEYVTHFVIPASSACLEFPLRGGGNAGIQSVGARDTPSIVNHSAGVFL